MSIHQDLQAMFGIALLYNLEDALLLDQDNTVKIIKISYGKKIWQLAPLRMIYSVKPDLHLNSRLVLGEHKVKANKHSGYASVVQQITQYYSKIPRT